MKTGRSNSRIARAALAALTVAVLAGCGGGGGGSDQSTLTPSDPGANPPANPPANTVTVASVTLPAENGIAILGKSKAVPAIVKGSDGSTLAGRTIEWTSSNTAIITVAATGAQGAVTPVATGDATITATVEGKTATMKLYVRNAPADLAGYKAMFPFVAQNGQFIVASDINQAYSDSRLAHLSKSWTFFEGFFPKKPGNWTEMYYTWDQSIVDIEAGTVCPTAARAALPGRLLRTCFEPTPGINSFLVAPDLLATGAVDVDHATALSTLGQSYLDSLAVPTYGWPWLWEGLSIAFKSGDFVDGPYKMRKLIDPDGAEFRQSKAAGTLLPLTPNLVALTRVHTDPPSGTWYDVDEIAEPQSAMLLNYLFVSNEAVVKSLVAAIDAGTVTTSQQAFDFVLAETGLSSDALRDAYEAYGTAP